jgi:hypothetical protein
MQEIELESDAVALIGALDVDRSPTGITPRRLPAWTRPQIPDIVMDVVVQMPSGVRVRFATDSTAVELDVALTHLQFLPRDLRPAVFDIVVNGELVEQAATTVGNVITIDADDPDNVGFEVGAMTTIRVAGLAADSKVVEIWLPQAATMELRCLRVDDGAAVTEAPPTGQPQWVHYGSSISHCMEADSPTRTWPAVAAQIAGVDVLNLGLGGQCMLDQFVARTIRDLPADVISLKVGINLVNGDSMRDRVFGPALHGFLDTVRDGHPETPLLVVSPIFCPSVETNPGPNVMGPGGRYVAVSGLEEIRMTCLTLTKIRAAIAGVVATRRELGDTNLHYLDGLKLFGPADAGDLPDDLHPSPAGYHRMGERFADLAFAGSNALARS